MHYLNGKFHFNPEKNSPFCENVLNLMYQNLKKIKTLITQFQERVFFSSCYNINFLLISPPLWLTLMEEQRSKANVCHMECKDMHEENSRRNNILLQAIDWKWIMT